MIGEFATKISHFFYIFLVGEFIKIGFKRLEEYLYLWGVHLKTQIKALFLLGVFMLMSFHQAIPHAHHEHKEEKKEVAHHHHSGEDHHHRDKKEENKSGGFLSFLLAIHSDTSTSNEIPVLKEHTENFRFQKTETRKKTEQKYSNEDWVWTDQESVSSKNYRPPKKYFNPYLSLLSLRGPPQLV